MNASIIGVSILFVAFGFFWLRAMTRMGEFSSLVPRFDGTCQVKLQNITGIEDLKIFQNADKRLIALSSYDRIAAKSDKNLEGAIYVFDINGIDNATPIGSFKAPNGFAPVGIDVSSNFGLAAINSKNGAKIELFDFKEKEWRFNKTVRIDGALRLNDVAFLDDVRFYVTNESDYPRDGLKNFVANFFDADKSGSIYYYDGEKSRKVATRLSFANSVTITKDKKYLIASATLGRELRFYKIDADNSLKLIQTVFLGTGIDNLNIDEDGRIFAGAHPRIFSVTKKFWFPKNTTPSQAIVIEPTPDFSGGNVDQVFLSDGKTNLGTISVAAKYGNQIFMGSVFDKGIMVCDLPDEWHQSKTHPANRLIDTNRDYAIKKAKKALEGK